MRHWRAASLVLAAATAACGADDSSDRTDPATRWASDSALLTVSDSGSVLLIRASPDCYGSFAITTEPIAGSNFSLPGSYTQLTGVYPGHVDYPAVLTGSLIRGQLSVAVAVESLHQTFGPFTLTRGAGGGWDPCLYP